MKATTKLTDAERRLRRRQREDETAKLRGDGLSYAEIAKRLGVIERVVIGYEARYFDRMDRRSHNLEKWGVAEVSTRLANALNNLQIENKEEALKAYKEGRFVWKGRRGIRHYGQKAHTELLRILGVEEPKEEPKKRRLCPNCGHAF